MLINLNHCLAIDSKEWEKCKQNSLGEKKLKTN